MKTLVEGDLYTSYPERITVDQSDEIRTVVKQSLFGEVVKDHHFLKYVHIKGLELRAIYHHDHEAQVFVSNLATRLQIFLDEPVIGTLDLSGKIFITSLGSEEVLIQRILIESTIISTEEVSALELRTYQLNIR